MSNKNSYKLKLYTSSVTNYKHSGYVLEEYDSNGNLLHKYYIDPKVRGYSRGEVQ